MTSILMLFADDYGSFTDSTIFMAFMVLCLVFYFSKKYAIKNDDTIAGIAVFLYMVFMFSYLFTVSPAHIPQYGTQTQKEMMAFCIKQQKSKDITIDNISDVMNNCKAHNNQKRHELKNHHFLEELDKMMDSQVHSK